MNIIEINLVSFLRFKKIVIRIFLRSEPRGFFGISWDLVEILGLALPHWYWFLKHLRLRFIMNFYYYLGLRLFSRLLDTIIWIRRNFCFFFNFIDNLRLSSFESASRFRSKVGIGNIILFFQQLIPPKKWLLRGSLKFHVSKG